MNRASILFGAVVALLGTGISASAETAPIAYDDWAETNGKTVQIYVLANDSGDIDPSTLALITYPTQGSASVIASGSPKIKYTTTTGSGTDVFQYAVCNSSGACSTATVTVTLAPVMTTTTPTTTTVIPNPTPITSPITTPPTSTPITPPTTLPVTPPSLSPSTSVLPIAPATSAASVDPFAALAIGSGQVTGAAGTTVGQPNEIDIAEDVRFLGRSGVDTLKLVAVPAVMVSGIIGFLLVGLPQNALGGLLGFLVGKRRRHKKDGEEQKT